MSEEKVPVFKTWTQWYVFVLLVLLLTIIGFYFFTQYFLGFIDHFHLFFSVCIVHKDINVRNDVERYLVCKCFWLALVKFECKEVLHLVY